MAIKDGDFVRVNFTGKIKENDEVVDTTYYEIAQEAEIFDKPIKRIHKILLQYTKFVIKKLQLHI